jgi:hypothetical protein
MRQAKTGVQPVTPITTHHDQGGIERVLLGVASLTDVWSFAALGKLPGGSMGPSGSSSGGSDSSGGANSASAAATAAPGGTLYALDESALMEGGAEAASAALLGWMLGGLPRGGGVVMRCPAASVACQALCFDPCPHHNRPRRTVAARELKAAVRPSVCSTRAPTGCYKFDRYKSAARKGTKQDGAAAPGARLVCPAGADR